jgi:hypothetical protein
LFWILRFTDELSESCGVRLQSYRFSRRNSFRRLSPGKLRVPEEKAAVIAAALHMRMRISQFAEDEVQK